MSKICKECIYYILRRLDFNIFQAMLKSNSFLRTAVSRGGFKITPEKFRQPKTTERLAKVISSDQNFLALFFTDGIRIGAKMHGLEHAYHAISPEWLKANWRPWFRTLTDARPLAYALFTDDGNEWARRLGEHLFALPSLWKKAPLPLRAGVAAPDGLMPELKTPAEARLVGSEFFARRKSPDALPTAASAPAPEIPENAPAPAPAAAENAPAPAHAAAENAPEIPENAPAPAPSVDENAPVAKSAPHAGLLPLTKNAPPSASPEEPLPATPPEANVSHANSSRVGDLSRERDQLAKQLRIQQEVHAREMAAKDQQLKKYQEQLAECADTFDDAVAEVRTACEREAKRQVADFEARALGVHPDQIAFAQAHRLNKEQLRERMGQLIARQRENNRRFRTRQQIRDDLQKIDQYLTQIQRVMEDAIQPVPELTELQKDLETKHAELTRQLRDDTEGLALRNNVKVLPQRLSACITELPTSADGLASCADLTRLIESPLGRKLFTPEELQAASEMLNRRRQVIIATMEKASEFNRVLQGEEHPLTPPVVHSLATRLDQFAEIDLFVDACNVILNDSYWTDVVNTPNGFAEAKRDFIERCRKKARFFRSMTLVFDSDLTNTNTEREGNFAILYPARKTEDQNADNYIVEDFERQAERDRETGEEHRRWLVTNDHGLQNRVVNCCEAIIANTGFSLFIQN